MLERVHLEFSQKNNAVSSGTTEERVKPIEDLMMNLYAQGKCSHEMTILEYRETIGLEEKYKDDSDLKKYTINALVPEINQRTDFNLEIDFLKSKGRLKKVSLKFSRKDGAANTEAKHEVLKTQHQTKNEPKQSSIYRWRILGGNCQWNLVEVLDSSTDGRYCVVSHDGAMFIDEIIDGLASVNFIFQTNDQQDAINYINENTKNGLRGRRYKLYPPETNKP